MAGVNIRSVRQPIGTRLNVMPCESNKVKHDIGWVDNWYRKMALRHSQVYEAYANIRGGMSIYTISIAYSVPEVQIS